MKILLAAGLAFACAGFTVVAQQTAAGNTSAADQEKPPLEEMLKGASFTNHTGMVMVKISESLWAGKYPVTQAEYKAVAGANPSAFAEERNPVDSVSWNDARSFCARLTQQEAEKEMLPKGFVYTLPTQAQWEQLMGDATPAHAVTSIGTRRSRTAAVGSLPANGLGLHDVRGNVWAWCLDPQDKSYRVLRGAAWDTTIEINLRPEFRWFSNGPDDRRNSYGFRAVLQPR